MKKIYVSILAMLAVNATFAQTVPTCSLNPTFIAAPKVGVFPDSVTNFVSGTVGVPYVENLTVKVPTDTSSSGLNFCFHRFELTNPATSSNYNLPPGLNFGSSNTTLSITPVNGAPAFKFPRTGNYCASVYGTPTTAGTYTLHLVVTPFVSLKPLFGGCSTPSDGSGGSGSLAAPQTLNYYIIKINAPIGVQEIGKDKFGLMQNSPNPFTGKTEIKYYVEDESNATLTVYNSLGAIVNTQTSKTQLGENTFTFDSKGLSAGVYIYTVTYKNSVSTKRLVITE